MKNSVLTLGVLGFVATLVIAACSSDDDVEEPGPSTSGADRGGTTGGGGAASGGKSSGGMTTAGIAGTSGSSMNAGGDAGAGGATSAGGEVGAGGSATPIGDAGMGGTLEAGGAGAGGASGDDDETVTVTPTTCGYTEVESDSSQNTSLDVEDGLKVICGKFDVGKHDAPSGLLDYDDYIISAAHDNLMRLELPSFKGLTRVEVAFDQTIFVITKPVSVFHLRTFGGAMIIRVRAFSEADLPAAVPYQVSFAGDDVNARCAANKGAATFVEAGDGATSRGNDVYRFFDSAASFTAASDSAEATGITLGASSYRIDGAAADVARVGDFLDGDSYAFHTGPTTTQVTVRADWTGGHDFDLFVMKAGSTSSASYSAVFSNTSPEYATARVQSNRDYIAFIGAQYSGASVNYSLTLCGESYAFNGP